MKKRINRRRRFFAFSIATAVLIVCAASTSFAQKSLNSKYPQPDFSAMEDYWEVVSYEYDFTTGGVPTFTVLAKRKAQKAPHEWDITWRDSNGVRIVDYNFLLDGFNQTKVGETVEATSHAPFKVDMSRVKSVLITEDPNGN